MHSADIAAILAQLHQAAADQQRAQDALRASIQRLSAPPADVRDDASVLARSAALLQGLTQASTEEQAVRELLAAAVELLPQTLGAFCLETEDQPLIIAGVWYDRDTWQNGQANDAAPLTQLARHALEQAMRLPLIHQGIPLGELRLWPLTPGTDLAGLGERPRLLALSAALGLGGLYLKRRLTHRTVRDALTGLFNRRYMEDTLARELHRATRNDTELGLILCELHGADDDRILQAFGSLLQASFRASDVCCRMSERRFAVVLPEASLNDCRRRTQDLLQAIGDIRLPNGETTDGLQAYVGVAAFPQHGRSPQDLLLAAESALLLASQTAPGTVAVAERFEN